MRGSRGNAGSTKGFTFVEAIVAVVVMGIAILPIMALLSQSLSQLTAAGEANERAAAMESALAIIDPVNPLQFPNGSTSMGNTELNWTSSLLVEPNETVQLRAGLAGYSVGFYDVIVSLSKNGELWFSFNTRKVGYRRIQSNDGPFVDTTSR